MPRRKKPKHITVIGRRWFQRTYGNTYHTATIVVDGVTVHKTERQYGYGDQYETTAMEWMEATGLVPTREESNGGKTSPWRHLEALGIVYERYTIDVPRERDL